MHTPDRTPDHTPNHTPDRTSNHTPDRTPDRIDDPTDRRLTDLEIKASFMDDLVDQLNTVVVRQQGQIDALVRELLQLRQQAPSDEPGGFRSLRDELPPHY